MSAYLKGPLAHGPQVRGQGMPGPERLLQAAAGAVGLGSQDVATDRRRLPPRLDQAHDSCVSRAPRDPHQIDPLRLEDLRVVALATQDLNHHLAFLHGHAAAWSTH